MDRTTISKATTDLAKRIQANSPTPLTWRQSVRRAMWCWELERKFQECQADLRQERGDANDR
jgi:hypothetical protein